MTDDRLLSSLTESSLFDTYLIYGIIGLLIFIALIGLIVLLITSCCCFYSVSPCCCCYRRQSTYKLNEKFHEQDDQKRMIFIKRHSSDIADFAQLYNSCPHLINSRTMTATEIGNRNFDVSCTTINTPISQISPCTSFRSLTESVPLVQNNLNIDKTHLSTKGRASQPFTYIKNPNDHTQILHRLTPHDRTVSPAVVSLDIKRISSLDNTSNNNQTNIYDTVIPITTMNSSSNRSTPIYEIEWTHNLKQLIMSKIPPIEKNAISVIELPSSSTTPSLVPPTDYFQQQNPYDTFFANRTKTSDSMRRANMLQRLKDDAAFLY